MQWCEMHGDVAVSQISEREHLSAVGRASASEYVPSPTKWLVGSVFCSKCCWSKWTGQMCCMQNIPELQDKDCR